MHGADMQSWMDREVVTRRRVGEAKGPGSRWIARPAPVPPVLGQEWHPVVSGRARLGGARSSVQSVAESPSSEILMSRELS